jgi:hypothetical protein
MKTRRTNVAWDETLIRVEYLDDQGEPYYCTFEKQDNAAGSDAAAGIVSAPANLARLSAAAAVVLLVALVAVGIWAAL